MSDEAKELALLIADRAVQIARDTHPEPKRAAYLIGQWALQLGGLLRDDETPS